MCKKICVKRPKCKCAHLYDVLWKNRKLILIIKMHQLPRAKNNTIQLGFTTVVTGNRAMGPTQLQGLLVLISSLILLGSTYGECIIF